MDPREALRKWRGDDSLSVAGKKIDCDPSLLRKLETKDHPEKRKPGLELAIRIRDVVGIPVEDWAQADAPAEKSSAASGEHSTTEPDAKQSGSAA